MNNVSRSHLKTLKPVDAMFDLGKHILNKEFEFVEEEFAHMDLFGFTPNGDSCEIEIKCGQFDIYKEMSRLSKREKHKNYKKKKGFVPTRYYFFVLKPSLKTAEKFLDEYKLPYGLLVYDSNNGTGYLVRKSERLSDLPFTGELNNYSGREYFHRKGRK